MSDTDIRSEQTGAPTDTGMPATAGAPATDATAVLGDEHLAVLRAVADHLIPAAHGMPSAGEVVDFNRLRFVITSRPDLAQPLAAALRPQLGPDPQPRLEALRAEPTNLAALQLVVVAGYYTDRRVRDLIGYPGQEAIEVKSWLVPPYIEEGLIDAVLARGPVWRDPATGRRATETGVPSTYAERYSVPAESGPPEGGRDGRTGS
jgi:hypothetical protein